MASFTNSKGGVIYIGVNDTCEIVGLSQKEVGQINQLIGNAASQLVKSPITVETENIPIGDGKLVIAVTISEGINKPYLVDGVTWLKSGSDKRRINSNEELRRMFQAGKQFHADELPVKATMEQLDMLRFRTFFEGHYREKLPTDDSALHKLLQNMNLVCEDKRLTLAGLLIFSEQPERTYPQFIVKAIRYPGNDIHATDYLDTQEIEGPLRKVYDDSIGFINRNLHRVQQGKGANAPGKLEIPEEALEELMVNALLHRDYMIDAPIRLFVFDNRIEIISPGHLPNNLTVEKILTGTSIQRNPILCSYAAKKILPYSGLGTGIERARKTWPHIEFTDDAEKMTFTATVKRDQSFAVKDHKSDLKGQGDLINDLIKVIEKTPEITYKEMAEVLRVSETTIKRKIAKLKRQGHIIRIGSNKKGYWVIK